MTRRARYPRRPTPLVIDGCIIAFVCYRDGLRTVETVAMVRRRDGRRDVERLARWLARAAAWVGDPRYSR